MDKTKNQIDRDDLNNETAGRDTGRIKRFFSKSAGPIHAEQNDADDVAFNIMMQMLADQYADHQQRLAAIRLRLEQLDQQSLIILQDAEEKLHLLREGANRDSQGRHIFKSSEDGAIYYEDGTVVSAEDIEVSNWRSDAPDFETFNKQKEALAEAARNRSKILEQKSHLEDEPDSDDLDDIEAELDALEAEFPDFTMLGTDLQKGSLLSSLYWRHIFEENKQVH